MAASGVDLYEILCVGRDASPEEIKKSYRRLARKYHPDVNGEADADERFKEINLAYEVLSDPTRRQQYDQFGTTDGRGGMGGDPFGGQGFTNIADIFDFFFGGGGGGVGFGGFSQTRTRQRPDYAPGGDIHRAVHLELEDILSDHEVELSIERQETCSACGGSRAEPGTQPEPCQTCGGRGMVVQVRDTLLGRMQTSSPCPQCRGTGYTIPNPCKHCRGSGFEARSVKHGVTVPAGIESGMTVRVAGQGHHGRGGAPAGDLLLTVTIEPHELFEREGPHLYLTLPVGYADLALGATVEVPTMGEPEKLRIPAGTPSHHTFTLRGRGLPRLQRSGHGDLTVQAELDVPRKVSKRQRELLEELRELESEAQERRGGFLKGIFGRDK